MRLLSLLVTDHERVREVAIRYDRQIARDLPPSAKCFKESHAALTIASDFL